jgi:outer membrane protein assembly factor BamA
MKFLFPVFLLIFSIPSFGQLDRTTDTLCPPQLDAIDLLRKLVGDKRLSTKERTERKAYFSFLPVSSDNSGSSPIIVTTFTAAFYTGPKESTNLSNAYFTPYVTPAGQFVFPLKSNIWLKNNSWNFIGDWRYMVYNENTYGLGSNSLKQDAELIQYDLFRFYQSGMHKIKGHWTGGLGFYYDHYFNILKTKSASNTDEFGSYGTGTGPASVSSGFSTILLYDSRKNSINPQNGLCLNAVYRVNPTWMGSDESWESLYLDFRKYISLSHCSQKVLAFWVFYWDTFNQNAPYLELPSNAWEAGARSGRGYDAGRFRGRGMVYAETEYRFDLTSNGLIGMVLFANTMSFREPSDNRFESLKPAAGTGLRFNANKASGTNVTLDVGFGENSVNYYIKLGECF